MRKLLLTISITLLCCAASFSQQNVQVASFGSFLGVDEPGTYNLSVAGTDNTITIAAGNRIATFDLDGSNNSIVVASDVAIGQLNITGSGNTITVPAGTDYRVNDKGSNNRVVQDR